jgi:hypothetical protein
MIMIAENSNDFFIIKDINTNISDFLPDIKYFPGYMFVKNVRKPELSRVDLSGFMVPVQRMMCLIKQILKKTF